MLFLGSLWLSLLAVCLSEDFWDPTDPRCEAYRVQNKETFNDILGDFHPAVFPVINLMERFIKVPVRTYYKNYLDSAVRRGCDDYESLKKTEFRCWSKEFLCAASEVVNKTLFEAISFEVNWMTTMRWNDPRLLHWSKDLDELGNKIFDVLFGNINTGNYEGLKALVHHYSNIGAKRYMEKRCKSLNHNKAEMQCKLGIVFDRLVKLLEDPVKDVNIPPTLKKEVYFLYLLKPDIYKMMIRSDDQNVTFNQGLRTMFTSFFDNSRNMDGTKMKDHFGKFNTICTLVKQDCDQLHSNDFEQMECYMSETCDRMERLKNSLGADYSNWESPKAQNKRAVVLVWFLLTPKGSFYVNATEKLTIQLITNLLKIMYKNIRENDHPTLSEFANQIPSRDQMGLTISDDCAPNFDQISREIKCGFKIILENLAIFLGQYNSREKNTKRLNLAVNYKQRLEQFQITSIRGAIENTKLELKSSLEEFSGEIKKYFEGSLGNRFDSLRQYHQTLASFDLEIANADIGYINGKLSEFAKTAAALNKKLKYDSSDLQKDVVLMKSIDAAFLWMKAAGSGISAVLGAFTGDFGGFADAADRVDVAAKATLEAVEGAAIGGQIEIASKKFKIIAAGLKNNQNQLEKTKILIDKLNDENADLNSEEFKKIQSDFIKAYNAYDPKVNEAQIAELDTAWSEVVDNLEGLMDPETKEATAVATESFADNHFFKIKLVVPQLTQTLSDRFDYQVEMMDSLAAAVRAHTSRQGAEALSEGFSELGQQLEESVTAQIALDQMALSTYILSQFHLLLILSQYCNYITYVNAGVESFKCTKALNTMDPVHIDDALSFSPPSCDVVRVNLKIPASLSGKTDSINLNQLNSGESVPFQIPNFEWLMVNGEISALDKDSALFVKLFEVYAITNDNYQIRNNLRVTVTPSGSAPIYKNSEVKYELLPSSRTSYVFEYKEHDTGSCVTEMNPYFVCNPGPKGICVRSRGELTNELGAYPSIYSPWTIQLDKNIGNAPNPANGTIFYLQAKLQLCRKTKDVKSLTVRKRSLLEKKFRKCKAQLKEFKANLSEFKANLSAKYKAKLSKFKATLSAKYKAKLSEYKAKLSKFKSTAECPEGKYYDQVSGEFVACSANSTTQHYHYYCEMN